MGIVSLITAVFCLSLGCIWKTSDALNVFIKTLSLSLAFANAVVGIKLLGII